MHKKHLSTYCLFLIALLLSGYNTPYDSCSVKLKNHRYISFFIEDTLRNSKEARDSFDLTSSVLNNKWHYLYDDSADSFIHIIRNANAKVQHFFHPFVNNFNITLHIDGKIYNIQDMSTDLIKKFLVPGLQNTDHDWVFNALCYKLSGEKPGRESYGNAEEWRRAQKKNDIEYWSHYKWK